MELWLSTSCTARGSDAGQVGRDLAPRMQRMDDLIRANLMFASNKVQHVGIWDVLVTERGC